MLQMFNTTNFNTHKIKVIMYTRQLKKLKPWIHLTFEKNFCLYIWKRFWRRCILCLTELKLWNYESL